MPGVLPSPSSALPLRLLEEPEDLGLLRSDLKIHYRSLGSRSRHLRFMGEPTPEALDRLAEQADPELVLEMVEDGVVRAVLEAYPASPGHVEVAISVQDGYQGQGLGRALFEEGLVVLASRGFRTADLVCLRENTALLHLVSRAGATLRSDGNEVQIAIQLDHVLEHVRSRPPELSQGRAQ